VLGLLMFIMGQLTMISSGQTLLLMMLTAGYPKNRNIPGDGKFDQSALGNFITAKF